MIEDEDLIWSHVFANRPNSIGSIANCMTSSIIGARKDWNYLLHGAGRFIRNFSTRARVSVSSKLQLCPKIHVCFDETAKNNVEFRFFVLPQ